MEQPKREFAIGAIRILPNCNPNLRKTLKDEFYVLNRRFKVNNRKQTVTLSSDTDMVDFFGKGITIQAVVGTNGSGKSSLFEIIYRAINNLSCLLSLGKRRKASEQLYFIDGLWVELYVAIDGDLYCIANHGDNITVSQGKRKIINLSAFNNFAPSNDIVMISDFIEWAKECLFYTIVSNYSLQAFNTQDYECEKCFIVDGKRGRQHVEDRVWINGLFHKNDGYLTPIVLNPYRDNGNIDMKKEHWLTLYRLSSAMIFAEKHNKPFMKDYKLHQILYTYSDESLSEKYSVAYNGKHDDIYWQATTTRLRNCDSLGV